MKNITNFRALLLTLCLTAFSILPSWALIGPYCESNITLLNGTPIQMSFVQTGTNDYVIVITSSSYKITAVNGFAHTSGNNTYHYGAAGHYSISDDGYTARYHSRVLLHQSYITIFTLFLKQLESRKPVSLTSKISVGRLLQHAR